MGDRLMQYLKGGVINNIEVYGDGSITITVVTEHGNKYELGLSADLHNYEEAVLDIDLEQVVTTRNKVHL